jgi:hypothetical protein
MGLKSSTEAAGVHLWVYAVGERWIGLRRSPVRGAGGIPNENAGMSSEKAGENPAHRKSKISWVKFVFPGLVGP